MVHVPAEVDRFSRLIRRIRPRAAGSIHGRGVAQAPGAHMNTCWAPDWLAIAYHEQTSSYSPPGCSRARWARWNTGKTLRSKPRKRGVVQRNAFSVFGVRRSAALWMMTRHVHFLRTQDRISTRCLSGWSADRACARSESFLFNRRSRGARPSSDSIQKQSSL